MSLILDALNRAEHERKNKNTVPDINTVHAVPSPAAAQPATARSMMIPVTLSVVVIAIIFGVWWFRSSSIAPSSAQVAAVSQTRPASQISPAAKIKEQPVVAGPQAVEVPIATAVVATASVAPAVENLYAEKSAEVIIPDASVEKLYEPEVVEPLSESVVTPFEPPAQNNTADIEAVNELADQALDQQSTGQQLPSQQSPEQQPPEQLITGTTTKPQRRYEEIDVQEFNSLAWNQKQQIPTISYSRHNFLPQNVSTVMINGEILGEGNAFGGGSFVVDEIFVDGVVLSFRGNKFKLRALNGWVNM